MFYLFLAPKCFQSRCKHFAVCISLCTRDLPYYTGMDPFQQQRLKPLQLLNLFLSSFYFVTAHAHTHFQHFENMHNILVYLRILLLDLRHLISAFSLMLNIIFNFGANMGGKYQKFLILFPSIIASKLKRLFQKRIWQAFPLKGIFLILRKPERD